MKTIEQANKPKKFGFSQMRKGYLAKNSRGDLLYVPNLTADRVGRFSVSTSQIETALDQNDVATLRSLSRYFWNTSGIYRRIVLNFANLLTFDYVMVPKVTAEDYASSAFFKAKEDVTNYLSSNNVKEISREIALAVVREGSYYGYESEVGDGQSVFQKLPPEYCRTRFKMGGVYAMEFDFSYFDQFRDEEELAEIFKSLPKEFETLYRSYKNDRDLRWALLDPTKTRVHVIDDDMPMFASIFPDLLDLEEYKGTEKSKTKLKLYKLLIQKLPTDENGEVQMLLDDVIELHDNARAMISNEEIDVITTPAPITAVDLTDRYETAQDDIGKATNAIYTTAGTPISLFNLGDKTGSVGLEASIKVDEAVMFQLLSQFESWYHNRLSMISSKYTFDLLFPQITIFNYKTKFETYSLAAASGHPTKLLAGAALGIAGENYEALLNYENLGLDLVNRMVPTKSAFQPVEEKEGGRPESEDPLTEEGQEARDQNKNDGRAEEVG